MHITMYVYSESRNNTTFEINTKIIQCKKQVSKKSSQAQRHAANDRQLLRLDITTGCLSVSQ